MTCELLKSGQHYIAFNLEGVIAMTNAAKKPWAQYLRRATRHTSLVMGTALGTALKELDDASNEDWMKMCTHNYNTTCMRTCDAFLSPEAMMIRMDMCNGW